MIRNLKYDIRDVSQPLQDVDMEEDEEELINYSRDTASLIIDRVIDSIPKDKSNILSDIESEELESKGKW